MYLTTPLNVGHLAISNALVESYVPKSFAYICTSLG
jgi:hypothetical protein